SGATAPTKRPARQGATEQGGDDTRAIGTDLPRRKDHAMAPTRMRVTSAAPFVPEHATLASLRSAATGCQGCDLYRHATQTVCGEGPQGAPLMMVGEQPGNDEDLAGRPFVGPAGRLLDRAIAEAGLDRGRIYVTNAVKHFKWKQEGGG